MMGFDTDDLDVYQIRRQHRNEEVRELIPSDYEGVMHCDRGKSYDAKELRDLNQQKCVGHVLRSIAEVLAYQEAEAAQFGVELKSLLQEEIALWKGHRAGEISDEEYTIRGRLLQSRVTQHLLDRELPDQDNRRLLEQIGKHDDRGNLLRFLHDERAEPTNNRAERALRSAVIARKVSHCSKNERGARAVEAYLSVIRTAVKRTGAFLVDSVLHLIPNPRPTGASP
jgi:hypothetical protein